MSRRNNKIATQAETEDLVSALSEASGSSSSSSAPIHATRDASAALFAKEIKKTLNRLRPVALGWDAVPFLQSRHSRFLLQAAINFYPRMTCLRVISWRFRKS